MNVLRSGLPDPAPRAVRGLLDRLIVPEQFREIRNAIRAVIYEHGQRLLPPLIETIGRDEAQLRVTASVVVLSMSQRCPSWGIPDAVISEAKAHVDRWIRASDDELNLWLCFVLVHLGHPHPSMSTKLSPLIDADDESVRHMAAAALFSLELHDPRVDNLTFYGALHDNIAIVAGCALSMSELGSLPPGLITALKKRLETGNEAEQELALTALLFLGPVASRAASAVRSIVADNTQKPIDRGYAAHVLGNISPGSRLSSALLADAVMSVEPLLAYGAAEGLAATGKVPQRVIDGLAGQLRGGDEDRKLAALSAISELGSHAEPLITVMLECTQLPMSFQFHSKLTSAIARIGPTAIPRLIRELNTGYISQFIACASVFVQLGQEGIWALSEATRKSENEWILAVLLNVVRELGPDAAVAVPTLGVHLEGTYCTEVLQGLLQAIGATGAGARLALPAIVNCLFRSDSVVADSAERVLRGLGQDGAYAIEQAIRATEGPERERLKRVLARLWHSHDSRYAYLATLDSDTALQSFVYMAELLLEHGPISMSQMEHHLRGRVIAGLVPSTTPISGRTLGVHVESLEQRLKCKLTTRIPGRKGMLTADGYALLDDAHAYLAAMRKE